MENNIFIEEKSLSSVLWYKFLSYLEENSLLSFFCIVCKVLISCVLAASLLDIRAAVEMLVASLKWANFAVPKLFLSFTLVFSWKIWFFWVKNRAISFFSYISVCIRPKMSGASFYGIPVVELVEYLFSGDGSFRRDDIERRFAIPRNRFDEMAKLLDDYGVFTRGKNNARSLNPVISREALVSMLSGEKEILPSPTSGFVVRPLYAEDI